jgi:hypothetical protein
LENRQVERALRTKLVAADRQALAAHMETLPAPEVEQVEEQIEENEEG